MLVLLQSGLILLGWAYWGFTDVRQHRINILATPILIFLSIPGTKPVIFGLSLLLYIPAALFSHTNHAMSRGDTAMILTILFTSQHFAPFKTFFHANLVLGIIILINKEKQYLEKIPFAPILLLAQITSVLL